MCRLGHEEVLCVSNLSDNQLSIDVVYRARIFALFDYYSCVVEKHGTIIVHDLE